MDVPHAAVISWSVLLIAGCTHGGMGVESAGSDGHAPQHTAPALARTAMSDLVEGPSHPLVESAREQIGVVTSYDTAYYEGGYPPEDRGACTDVVSRALRDVGYDLKAKIDRDMREHPRSYPHEPDPNINVRRVRNVRVFLQRYAASLPTCTTSACFREGVWRPGDIVTFDQIPGGLWHIAIISSMTRPASDDRAARVPLLIHNYGRGTVEDDMLLHWPTGVSGHFRLSTNALAQ